MAKFALIGASGTGKTTIFELLKKRLNTYTFVGEETRALIPDLGYNSPWDFVSQYGISVYETILLSSWAYFRLLEKQNIISDRSPIDNLAYYYCCRKEDEIAIEPVLIKLFERYISCFDSFIYFPYGMFPFQKDSMREVNLQQQHGREVLRIVNSYSLDCRILLETKIESRLQEVLNIIY